MSQQARKKKKTKKKEKKEKTVSAVEKMKKLFSPSASGSSSSTTTSSAARAQTTAAAAIPGLGLAMGASISMFGAAAINAKRAQKKKQKKKTTTTTTATTRRAVEYAKAALTPLSKLASDVRMISGGRDAADGDESEELASLGAAAEKGATAVVTPTPPTATPSMDSGEMMASAAGEERGRRTHDPIAQQLGDDAYKAKITPIKVFRNEMQAHAEGLEHLEILAPQKIRA